MVTGRFCEALEIPWLSAEAPDRRTACSMPAIGCGNLLIFVVIMIVCISLPILPIDGWDGMGWDGMDAHNAQAFSL